MNRLDLTVLGTICTILLILGAILLIGNPSPLQVTCGTDGNCAQLGPYATVSLAFSRPVEAQLIQDLWSVTPSVSGSWQWLDDQNATWQANMPLAVGERITLQLNSGQAGKTGETFQRPVKWIGQIRQPEVIFEMNQGKGSELYTLPVSSDGSQTVSTPRQVSHSDGFIYDYAISKNGEWIIYSAMNESKGVDIWILRRDGSGERMLLNCASDRCTTPAWSPVSNEIAYTRESAGLDPNGPKGAPRIWIVNVDSAQTNPLFDDPQKIGYGPKWSPDGQWLSTWAGSLGGIQVVNRNSGDTILLSTPSGDTGCWSPDSKTIYYSDLITTSTAPRYTIEKADLAQDATSMALGFITGDNNVGFSGPVCHPLEDLFAVAVQKNGTQLNSELDVLSPASKGGVFVAKDSSKVFDAYSWNPDGSYLIYQAIRLGGKADDTEIWIWSYNLNKSWKLIDGAHFPKILP